MLKMFRAVKRKSIRETKVRRRDKKEERKSICHAVRYNARKNLLIIGRPFRYSMKFFPMTGENFSESLRTRSI